MKSISRFTLLALAAALVTSCSGNSSSTKGGTVDDNTFLTGYVGASDISFARINAVPLSYEGRPDTEVDADGNVTYVGQNTTSAENTSFYQVNLATSYVGNPIIIIATSNNGKATYTCEVVTGCGSSGAYSSSIVLDTDYQVRAGVGEALESMRVNINWITDLASSLATSVYIDVDGDAETDTQKTGFYSEYSIELANLHVDELFGISDIISVTPISPSNLGADTSLAAPILQEGIIYGAYIAAIQKLAVDRNTDYYGAVNLVLTEFLLNQGQIYQKNTAGSEISLYELTIAAADVLDDNIEYLSSVSQSVPAEAEKASSILRQRAAVLLDGELTDIEIDVPEALANWKTSIEKSKTFITDLNKRLLNFKGENPNEVSFIDGGYANQLESYYDGYTDVYNAISPSLDGVLQDVRDAIDYYLECLNSSTVCADSITLNGRSLVFNSTNKTLAIHDGDTNVLTLSYSPVDEGSKVDGSSTTYLLFDIFTEGSLKIKETGTSVIRTITFSPAKNSIDVDEQPRLRLSYSDYYSLPPTKSDDQPSAIDVAWPSVVLDNVSINGDVHTVEALFETNLFGVSDPYDTNVNTHYNPITVVFWLKSAGESLGKITNSLGEDAELQNYTSWIMEMSTVNGKIFYPDSEWPEFSNFFIDRPEAELEQTVTDFATFYRSSEQVITDKGATDSTSDDVVQTADYIDIELKGVGIARYRVFPYDSSIDSSKVQICTMSEDGDVTSREVISCGSLTNVAGIESLDEFLQSQFEKGAFDNVEVAAHGIYSIQLATNTDGTLATFNVEDPVSFDATLERTLQLGIKVLYLTATASLVTDAENEVITPTVFDTSLVRKVKDYFEISTLIAYAYDYISSGIVPVSNNNTAQGLYLSYIVDFSDSSDINIEIGSLVVTRQGVTLFGNSETIGLVATSRVEYSQSDTNFSCGAYNRDELVSGDDCEAVAYLRYRGSLMATIREERPGVYIVRYVDGTWIMLGES